MQCWLCRWLERAVRRNDRLWATAADSLAAEWANDGLNSDDVFATDPDQDRLRALTALQDSDPKAAFSEFLALAEAGSVWSMFRVGHAYEMGNGTARDLARAERWFVRAHEKGADFGLARAASLAFRRGDRAAAQALLETGAARGLGFAYCALAALELGAPRTRQTRERALELYEQAIARGYRPAEWRLAWSMALGRFGWRKMATGWRRLNRIKAAALAQIEARKRQLFEAGGARLP